MGDESNANTEENNEVDSYVQMIKDHNNRMNRHYTFGGQKHKHMSSIDQIAGRMQRNP